MHSIPAALTWEIIHRGRWPLAGAFVGSLGLPLLVFTALQREGALDPAANSTIMMQVIMTQVSLLGLGAGAFTAVGVPSRMFALPVTTPGIVLSHLIPSGVLAAGLWMGCVGILNAFLPLEWPILGPTLFAAVAVPLVLAVSWYADKSVWLPVFLGAAAGAPFLWLKSRFGEMFSTPTHQWLHVTVIDGLFLTAIGVCAYFVGVAGVARQRRHEPLGCPRVLEWLARELEGGPAGDLKFRSAEEAQLWLEWRSKGILLPGVVIFFGAVAFLGWLLFSRDARALFQGVLGAGMVLPSVAGILGLVIGNYGPTDSNSAMGPWMASRPMTSPMLARIVLKTQFRAVAICTVLWQIAMWTVWAFLESSVAQQEIQPAAISAAIWILPWAAASVGTLVCLSGRSNLIGMSFTGATFLTLVVGMMIQWFNKDVAGVYFQGVVVAAAVASIAGAVVAFWTAHRRGMISSRVIAACGLAICAVLPVAMWILREQQMLTVVPVFAATAVMAWSVAPFAMAPLAVASNRNR